MNDYIVITSVDLGSLCKRVVEGMDEGYYPLGNIAMFGYTPAETEEGQPDRIFYQAMAKYKQ
jgi:hypothetical protein